MAVGRVRNRRSLGRYELFLELAQSYLGSLWTVRVTSGDGAGLVAMLREISLAEVNPSQAEWLLHAAHAEVPPDEPALMNTLELITTPTEIGLVYDYVEAETLRGLQSLSSVRRKPIPLDIALRISTDILEAVSTLHAGVTGRILYGGLSPDRILVGTDGRARIIDVGIAAAANNVEAFGQHPERIAYAAPEQVGTSQEADARTDLFTIGVLLWEMLSNRRLFIGSDQAVAQKVIAAKIPRLDQVKRRGDLELPEKVISFVARALERDRNARYQSAAEMLTALHSLGTLAEREQVSEFVELVSEGALGRRRDAIKDELRGKPLEPLSSKVKRLPSATHHAAPPKEKPRSSEASSPKHEPPQRAARSSQIGMPPLPRAPSAGLAAPPPLPPPTRTRMKTIVGIPIAPITSGSPGPAPVLTPSNGRSAAAPKAEPVPPPPVDLFRATEKSGIETRSPTAEALRAALTAEEDADSVRRAREPQQRAQEMAQPQDWDEDFATTATATTAQLAAVAQPVLPAFPAPPPTLDRKTVTHGTIAQFSATPAEDLATVPTNPEPTIPILSPPSEPEAARFPPSAPDFADLTEPDLAPPRLPNIAPTPKPKMATIEPVAPQPRRAPAGASLPPAAIFPSQIPPPLIHDPRANFRPPAAESQQKPKYFARGVIAGMIGTFVVIALGVGLGLALMRTRQPAPPANVEARPEAPPPAAKDEQRTEATAVAPTPASAAPSEAQNENQPDAGVAAAPAPAPSASASATAASAPTAAPAKAAPAPRRAAPRRAKPRKFTPDDI